MEKLKRLLNEIAHNTSHFEKKNINISSTSVGWQLEHIMLVLNSVIGAIETSNPQDYHYKWNFKRTIVMSSGFIPRGKAKAPNRVQPREEFTEASLKLHLAKTRENVNKLKMFNESQFFPHPYLGDMKLKATIKFLGIHTKHHLKIVDDILK